MSLACTCTSRPRAAADALLHGPGLDRGAVAEVEREPEARWIAETPGEHLEVVDALDEHPALGLHAEHDARPFRARQHALEAVHQQRPRADGVEVAARRTRAQRHDGRAERGGDVDRAAQQLEPALAAFVEQARVIGAGRSSR